MCCAMGNYGSGGAGCPSLPVAHLYVMRNGYINYLWRITYRCPTGKFGRENFKKKIKLFDLPWRTTVRCTTGTNLHVAHLIVVCNG
jgi:hypothetical protein